MFADDHKIFSRLRERGATRHRIFLFTTILFLLNAVQLGADDQTAPIPRTQLLSVPPLLLNFKFQDFQTFWIDSETSWKDFWNQNSRDKSDPPDLGIDWKNQILLVLFWPSQDTVVRIPSFSGSEPVLGSATPKIRLKFNLNTPCLGIITDQSPSMFVVFDTSVQNFTEVDVRTQNTKSIGCF